MIAEGQDKLIANSTISRAMKIPLYEVTRNIRIISVTKTQNNQTKQIPTAAIQPHTNKRQLEHELQSCKRQKIDLVDAQKRLNRTVGTLLWYVYLFNALYLTNCCAQLFFAVLNLAKMNTKRFTLKLLK